MTTTIKGPNVLGLYLESLNDVELDLPLVNADVLSWNASTETWVNVAGSSEGTGTVTQVAVGTGLTASPSPITTSGTISLTNTAVTPGSYTLADITVNAQGQITAASSGSSGIANVTTGDTFEAGYYTTVWSGNGTSGSPLNMATPWNHVAQSFALTTNASPTTVATLVIPAANAITAFQYDVCVRDATGLNCGYFTNITAYTNQGSGAVNLGRGTQNEFQQTSSGTILCSDQVSGSNAVVAIQGLASTNLSWFCTLRIYTY
jgi:hypothetical protein